MKSSKRRRLLTALIVTSCISATTTLAAGQAHAQCTTCNGSFLTENYTSAAGWTSIASACPGTVTVGGAGQNVLFSNATDSRSKRVYRSIPALNYADWTAEAQVTVMAAGNASSMDVIAFTNGVLDPWVTDAACPAGCTTGNCYTPTNQDSIFAYLSSGTAPPTNATCCQNPADPNYRWSFFARAKRGTNLLPASAAIDVPSLGTYYVRLQRTWSSQGLISVFSDAAMTNHVPGSPQCFAIDPVIQTLNVLQHGVHTQGSNLRVVNATIDNLRVCSGNTCPLSLTPSFTAQPSYCGVAPITVDGSATTGSPLPQLNHEWLITEADQFGNTTFNPATTWSQWYPGPAATFTFPANLYAAGGGFIQCGKYYLVRLGVQNCGNRFVSTGHVIHISCPPIADAGPDKTMCCCGPQKLKIGSPAVAGMQYQWSPSLGLDNPTLSSPTIDMSTFGDPSTPFPSTYEVTVTDAFGCTAKDSVYIKTVCSCRPPANVTLKRNGVCESTYTLTANCACGDSTPSNLWMPGGETTASIVVPAGSGPYTVTCRNECAATVSPPIVVPPATTISGGFPNILFPNVFTPNGDGVNDLWIVTDTTGGTPAYNATDYEFIVHNRWGNTVVLLSGSTTSGFANGSIPAWDGRANRTVLYSWWQRTFGGRRNTHAGDALSDGTYYYIFRLRNCSTGWTDVHVGYITLLR